jgi:hypothetical protein
MDGPAGGPDIDATVRAQKMKGFSFFIPLVNLLIVV